MEDDFLGFPSNASLTNEEIIRNATIIDEGIQENVASSPPLTHAEIIKNATIIDEGIKLCPLCRNEVRLYFINLNEKVLICENFECDYPFGHDEVTLVKEDKDVDSNAEVASIRSGPTVGTSTVTCSVISTDAMSEIDRINRVNDIESDGKPDLRDYYKHKHVDKVKKKPRTLENNPKIIKEVEAMKKIHMELDNTDQISIKNERWIKNLMNLQQTSGLSLLKPEEMSMFKQNKPEIGLGELKIDINTNSQENMIQIHISNSDVNEKDVIK